MLDPKPDLDFSKQGDKSGGLLQPKMTITGLSRLLGPVAGKLETIRKGTFDPTDVFGAIAEAKLFGVFSLSQVIDKANVTSALNAIPRFTHETLPVAHSFLHELEAFKGYLGALKSEGVPLPAIATNLDSTITNIFAELNKPNVPGIAVLNTFKAQLVNLAKNLPAAKSLKDIRHLKGRKDRRALRPRCHVSMGWLELVRALSRPHDSRRDCHDQRPTAADRSHQEKKRDRGGMAKGWENAISH
jgi:hypothetical protein